MLTDILLHMDKFDLYGKLAIPKRHDFEYEVPELYRIAAGKKGVFVNPALTEPFGLTLLEAASCGLPIVATKNGGPRDIVKNCQNGILVDPTNRKELGRAIRKILVNPALWKEYSSQGIINVRRHYSWDAHGEKYMRQVEKVVSREGKRNFDVPRAGAIGRRLTQVNRFVITDIDNTLIGDEEALPKLLVVLKERRQEVGFGIATGRTIASAVEVLEENGIPAGVVLLLAL